MHLHTIQNATKPLLCELSTHLLAENPIGHGRAFNDLCFQHFVHQNNHHLGVEICINLTMVSNYVANH
jgi:hypothetical protein